MLTIDLGKTNVNVTKNEVFDEILFYVRQFLLNVKLPLYLSAQKTKENAMENKASIGVFQKHENNKLAYVLLAFTQGKR